MNVRTAALSDRSRPLGQLLDALAPAPRWLVLLGAALFARCLTFGNPLVHVDENFYFATAQQMLHGALPFVEVWDRKPIGLFLVYVPAAALGMPLGIWAYQAMALASVVATALLIAGMADRAGWRRGALPAALLYIFMLNLAGGQGGQSPVFYNLPMAAAASLIMMRADCALDERGRRRRALWAMALIGIAMQIKYSAMFEGMFFGLWLLWREYRFGATLAKVVATGAVLAGVAALPTLLVWAYYLAIGHGDAWFYANVISILERQDDPLHALLRNVRDVTLILAPVLTMSWLSSRLPADSDIQRTRRNYLLGWLIAAILGLISFGGFFNHYTLPVLVPACLCSAGFLGDHRIGRRLMVPFLAIALIGGMIEIYVSRLARGDGEELHALTQAIGHGPGCIYLYSGPPMLYSSTGRCVSTAWLFPRHLSRVRESRAIGVDQVAEIDRIFRKRPAVITVAEPYDGERADVRRRTMQQLQVNGYHLRGIWPIGDDSIAVYETQAAVAADAPRARAASRPS